MAKRRRRTRRARRSNPTHRPRAHRRSPRRRRRNPSFNVVGTLIAGLGGGALGGARYALEMTNLSRPVTAAIAGVGGLALGAAVSGFSAAAGAGVAGAGVGIAVLDLLKHFVSTAPATEKKDQGVKGIDYDYTPQLGRVQANIGQGWQEQLGAIRANIG